MQFMAVTQLNIPARTAQGGRGMVNCSIEALQGTQTVTLKDAIPYSLNPR